MVDKLMLGVKLMTPDVQVLFGCAAVISIYWCDLDMQVWSRGEDMILKSQWESIGRQEWRCHWEWRNMSEGT